MYSAPIMIGIGMAAAGISAIGGVYFNRWRRGTRSQVTPTETDSETDEPCLDVESQSTAVSAINLRKIFRTYLTLHSFGAAAVALFSVYKIQSEIGYKTEDGDPTPITLPQFLVTYGAGIAVGTVFLSFPNRWFREKMQVFLNKYVSVEVITTTLAGMLVSPYVQKEVYVRWSTIRYGIMATMVFYNTGRMLLGKDDAQNQLLPPSVRKKFPFKFPVYNWNHKRRMALNISATFIAISALSTLGRGSSILPIKNKFLVILFNNIAVAILGMQAGSISYWALSRKLGDKLFIIINSLTTYVAIVILRPGMKLVNVASIVVGASGLWYLYAHINHSKEAAESMRREQSPIIEAFLCKLPPEGVDTITRLDDEYRDGNWNYLNRREFSRSIGTFYKVGATVTVLSIGAIALDLFSIVSNLDDYAALIGKLHGFAYHLELIAAGYGLLFLERKYRQQEYEGENISNILSKLRYILLNPIFITGLTLYTSNLRSYIKKELPAEDVMKDPIANICLFITNLWYASAFMNNLFEQLKYYMVLYLSEEQMMRIKDISDNAANSPEPQQLTLAPGEAAYITSFPFWKKKDTYNSLAAAVQKHLQVTMPDIEIKIDPDTVLCDIRDTLERHKIKYTLIIEEKGIGTTYYTSEDDQEGTVDCGAGMTLHLLKENDEYTIIFDTFDILIQESTEPDTENPQIYFNLRLNIMALLSATYGPEILNVVKEYIPPDPIGYMSQI